MKRALLCLLLFAGLARGQYWGEFVTAQVGGRVSPNGAPIQCDLPGALHLHNKGGSDGAGLCVFTSMDHTGRWQSIPQLIGMRDYMTRFPGGGWPEKVDQYLKRRCEELKLPVPRYIHVRKTDLAIMARACETGRMVCITYNFSPTGRYGGGHISHMVNLPHCDSAWCAVLDNNYEGDTKYEWMTPAELTRVMGGERGGWAMIFLDHGPPPPLVAPAGPRLDPNQGKDGLS